MLTIRTRLFFLYVCVLFDLDCYLSTLLLGLMLSSIKPQFYNYCTKPGIVIICFDSCSDFAIFFEVHLAA